MGLLVSLPGCGSTVARYQKSAERPKSGARWAMLPFVNHSETPQAGERVEAMLGTILRAKGVRALDTYTPGKEEGLAATDAQRSEESMAWAKTHKFEYAVTGSVEEWRYKSGIDGEPAIGVTLRVVELGKNATVWSASGSKTGGASDNVSGVALKLLDTMVSELELGP